MEYVNDLALIPEQSFLKIGEGKGGERRKKKCEIRRARGAKRCPGSRSMGSITKQTKKGEAREAPRLSPVGSPCLVPHMAFLPRHEGGEAITLLNKSPKRAKRRG